MAAYVTVSVGESARTARPLIATRDEAVVNAVMRALRSAIDGEAGEIVEALRRGRTRTAAMPTRSRRGQDRVARQVLHPGAEI